MKNFKFSLVLFFTLIKSTFFSHIYASDDYYHSISYQCYLAYQQNEYDLRLKEKRKWNNDPINRMAYAKTYISSNNLFKIILTPRLLVNGFEGNSFFYDLEIKNISSGDSILKHDGLLTYNVSSNNPKYIYGFFGRYINQRNRVYIVDLSNLSMKVINSKMKITKIKLFENQDKLVMTKVHSTLDQLLSFGLIEKTHKRFYNAKTGRKC